MSVSFELGTGDDASTGTTVLRRRTVPSGSLSRRAAAFGIEALLKHDDQRTLADCDCQQPPPSSDGCGGGRYDCQCRNDASGPARYGATTTAHFSSQFVDLNSVTKERLPGEHFLLFHPSIVKETATDTSWSESHHCSVYSDHKQCPATDELLLPPNGQRNSHDGGKPDVDGALDSVVCRLAYKELWDRFDEIGTEMIITKSGRRMFPTIRVCFSGLDPQSWYLVYVDIVPLDDKRYRYSYHKSRWVEAGSRIELANAAAERPRTAAIYQGAWVKGENLNRQLVSFDRIKLTNNATNEKCGHVVLSSMCMYQPRVHLVRRRTVTSTGGSGVSGSSNFPITVTSSTTATTVPTAKEAFGKSCRCPATCDERRTFVFPETMFIAVTAYQNQLKLQRGYGTKRPSSPSTNAVAQFKSSHSVGVQLLPAIAVI